MVRATLLLNVLVLIAVAVVLFGVEVPAPDGLTAVAGDALDRLQTWADAAWTWAQAALERARAWAAGQLE